MLQTAGVATYVKALDLGRGLRCRETPKVGEGLR
jgi:hypothetical protein